MVHLSRTRITVFSFVYFSTRTKPGSQLTPVTCWARVKVLTLTETVRPIALGDSRELVVIVIVSWKQHSTSPRALNTLESFPRLPKAANQ